MKKIEIFAVPSEPSTQFSMNCGYCDKLLSAGIYAVAIQVFLPNYQANLLLAEQRECFHCGKLNISVHLFKDSVSTNLEIENVKEYLRKNQSFLNIPMIPDISQKDLDEIFESPPPH
jgi:hypothetical protein